MFGDDVDDVLADKVARHATDSSPADQSGEFADTEYTEFTDERSERMNARHGSPGLKTIIIGIGAVTGGLLVFLIARWLLRGLLGKR